MCVRACSIWVGTTFLVYWPLFWGWQWAGGYSDGGNNAFNATARPGCALRWLSGNAGALFSEYGYTELVGERLAIRYPADKPDRLAAPGFDYHSGRRYYPDRSDTSPVDKHRLYGGLHNV